MGISKQKQMEEMREAASWTFEEACEDDLIERSIEDDAIKADMKRQDDAIRKAKNNG